LQLSSFAGLSFDSYVVKSVDSGLNWSHTKQAPGVGAELGAYALAVDPVAGGKLYAGGTGTPNLARSADGGTTWTAVSPGIGFPFAVTADSRLAPGVYAGMMNVQQNASLGIFKSTNEGGSWTQKNAGLPAPLPRINFLLADPANPSYLHAATEAGYFFSLDAAENWTAANSNLNDTYVNALAITGSRRLLAATSSGLLVLDLSTAARARADFNRDGKSDVFWLHATLTQAYVWQMNGTSIAASGSPSSTGDTGWQVKGIGDFDGDGKADVLFRHSVSGATVIWLMNGLNIASAGLPGTVAEAEWQVQGVGDFDGDGKADILWMHSDGTVLVWKMNGTSMTSAASPATLGAASGWVVQGIGDFNGDGKSDILWRHTSGLTYVWLMNGAAIASSGSPASVGPTTATGWLVQGVGDFDGDGKADILWRNDDLGGIIYVWKMNGAAITSAAAVTGVGTVAGAGWEVKAIGDYNGDGLADVLWKNDTQLGGIVYVWLMNGSSISSADAVTGVADLYWQVQNPK
jgi:hypothetical protein